MSVLVDKNNRLIVQAITGREGLFHVKGCAQHGRKALKELGMNSSVGTTVNQAADFAVAAAKG